MVKTKKKVVAAEKGESAAPCVTMTGKVAMAEYMSVVQAEAATGVSRWYWRGLAYKGLVESVKLGSPHNGRLVIPVAEIRRVMRENTRPRTDFSPLTAEVAR